MVTVRRKKIEDCADFEHVMTVSWNESYKGILSEELLNGLIFSEKNRTERSIREFDINNNHQFVLDDNGTVVGFVIVGPSNVIEYDRCGEIYALYIINAYKGNGYGKKLVEAGKKELKEMGFNRMVIGCFEKNPSNDFYKHLGGSFFKKRFRDFFECDENLYFFDSLD